MSQRTLLNAQARLDQLQKQLNEAFDRLEADPTSHVKQAHREEDLKDSLHKAEDVVDRLAATAGSETTPGRGSHYIARWLNTQLVDFPNHDF